ncbi:MAG: hypothetical protein IKU13_01640 [Clostridia bacterium]|nr:hypothetical protein [Clostridia bacterium]MBR5265132.1 hypothetical protein [Clostridia bacterium]
MITINDFTQALADHIEKKTNILTVTDRFKGRTDAGFVVSASEGESNIIAGGTQLERRFDVSVIIFRRNETEGKTMKKRLFDSLFPYFKVCDRYFTPLNAEGKRTENMENIIFNVRFCDALGREQIDYELMGNVRLNIISGGAYGITTDCYQL